MIKSEKKIKNFCLIGEKIANSASPLIHNHVFFRDGIEAKYELVQILKGDLTSECFLDLARTYSGINVTNPFKTIVAAYLKDNLSAIASKTRSVNTVKIDSDGKVKGYNTDVTGLRQGIFEIVISRTLFPSRLVLLGGGGVARSVLFGFLDQHQKYGKRKPPEIIIALRDIEKNVELVNILAGISYGNLKLRTQFLEWDEKEIAGAIQAGGLIVNATPLGSSDYLHNSPLNFENFIWKAPSRIFAIDLIYSPSMTGFLKSAEKIGAGTINGVGMLLYQALASQSIWLERPVSESGLLGVLKENDYQWIR